MSNRPFFAEPPAEIGRIQHAWSNIGEEGRAIGDTDAARRADQVIVAVVGAVGGGLLGIVPAFLLTRFLPLALYRATWLACIVGGAFWLARRWLAKPSSGSHLVNHFVGDEGFAIVKKADTQTSTVVRFADVAAFRRALQRNEVNGFYKGDQMNLSLRDSAGREFYSAVAGFKMSEPSGEDDEIMRLRAIDRAWSAWSIAKLEAEWSQTGSVRFDLAHFRDGASIGAITLGRGELEVLDRHGVTRRFTAAQVGSMWSRDGVLVIGEPGAKEGFFSSEGVLARESLANIANVDAFARVAERAGFHWVR